MDRTLLPYRKNCEGYFVSKNGEVLAQNTGLGYVEFPGGGVEDSTPEEAILRETKEEAGATITGLELFKSYSL